MQRGVKSSHHYSPSTGVRADFKRLMNEFLTLNTVRYEQFSELWRKRNLSYLCAGRGTDREAREFIERVFLIAQEYFLPPFQFQVRVGGLYLLYAIFQIQPLMPKVKIRMTPAHWEDTVYLQHQAAQQDHLDVVYVFNRLLQEQAFHFCFTPTEMSSHGNPEENDDNELNLAEDLKEEKRSINKLFNYESMEKLSYLQDQYQQMKIGLAGSDATKPDKSLDVVHNELVDDLVVLLQTFKEKVASTLKKGKVAEETPQEETANKQETSGGRRQMLKAQAYSQITATSSRKTHNLVVVESEGTSAKEDTEIQSPNQSIVNQEVRSPVKETPVKKRGRPKQCDPVQEVVVYPSPKTGPASESSTMNRLKSTYKLVRNPAGLGTKSKADAGETTPTSHQGKEEGLVCNGAGLRSKSKADTDKTTPIRHHVKEAGAVTELVVGKEKGKSVEILSTGAGNVKTPKSSYKLVIQPAGLRRNLKAEAGDTTSSSHQGKEAGTVTESAVEPVEILPAGAGNVEKTPKSSYKLVIQPSGLRAKSNADVSKTRPIWYGKNPAGTVTETVVTKRKGTPVEILSTCVGVKRTDEPENTSASRYGAYTKRINHLENMAGTKKYDQGKRVVQSESPSLQKYDQGKRVVQSESPSLLKVKLPGLTNGKKKTLPSKSGDSFKLVGQTSQGSVISKSKYNQNSKNTSIDNDIERVGQVVRVYPPGHSVPSTSKENRQARRPLALKSSTESPKNKMVDKDSESPRKAINCLRERLTREETEESSGCMLFVDSDDSDSPIQQPDFRTESKRTVGRKRKAASGEIDEVASLAKYRSSSVQATQNVAQMSTDTVSKGKKQIKKRYGCLLGTYKSI